MLGALVACSPEQQPHAVEKPAPVASRDATVPKSHVNDPLPLERGERWVYDAVVTDQTGERRVRWVTEVIDATERDGVRTYKLRGWPADLVSWDGAPVASERVMTRSFENYAWGDQLWFSWPLANGQQICPETDRRYCWQVTVDKGRYALSMRTNPDDETFELTPGIGLTRYIYHHHGSQMDVDAKHVPGRARPWSIG